MNKRRFWKTFAVVLVVALAANVVVAYFWGQAFPNSSWSWDTTTTTAVMLALIVAYAQGHRNGNQK